MCSYFIDSIHLRCGCKANVSEFLCQTSHDVTRACTVLVCDNRYNRCVYWAWGSRMQMRTCMCWRRDRQRCCFSPFDLTQPWTLLPRRSIRIICLTPSLSSRLMHGGVKHLVMLNHSGGEQYASSHPEWQHRGSGRGPKKYHITPREDRRKGMAVVREGQERNGGKEDGVEVELRSAWKTSNIRYSCNTWVAVIELLPHFSSLDIVSHFLTMCFNTGENAARCNYKH